MNLKDARDQIEREHPELTGSNKIAAIKALRDQAKAAEQASAPPAKDDAAPARPVRRKGWGNFLAWLAVLQLAGVIAAVVAAFHPFAVTGGLIEHLVMWPAAVHPAWLGIVAAIAAFFAAASASNAAGRLR